jgi:transcription initiation factor TFIIIB Brf1 subunit/transcription initiation factor TFIIB
MVSTNSEHVPKRESFTSNDALEEDFEPCLGGEEHSFITKNGTRVCENCGFVAEMNVISNEYSQPRNIETEQNEMMPEGHLSSGTTKKLDIKECKGFYLRRAAKTAARRPWKDRRIERGIGNIKRILGRHDLERLYLRAIKLYRIAVQSPLFRGHKLLVLAYACAYYVIKEAQFPLSLDSLLADCIYPTSLVLRYYDLMLQVPGFHRLDRHPRNVITKVCSEMGLEQTVVNQSLILLNEYMAHDNFSGQDPRGLVAACIYLATIMCHVDQSQAKICKDSGVTETTLRKRLNRLKAILQKYT